MNRPLPRTRGTYGLVLHLRGGRRVLVGKLGTFQLQDGYYLYVGSAFGPGGIGARVQRHLGAPTRHHWHVDHLRRVATPVAVWFADDEVPREHDWAQAIGQTPVAEIPIPRFGSSDCWCQSHLFYLAALPSWRWLRKHCRGVVHTVAIAGQPRKAE